MTQTDVTTVKWTIEQYHQMVEAGILDGLPVELLNGEIVEMSPEREPHAYFSRTTRAYLASLLGSRAEISEGHPITLPGNSEPEPDLAIIQPLGREYLDHHPYPENIYWIIEFSHSSLTKDLNPKAQIYAAAGIAEYWVVNLKSRALIVLTKPEQSEYQSQVTLTDGTISPIAFPDVILSVRRLLV